MDFKVGDVVKLNSGGPSMTVDEIDSELDVVTCTWFDGDHKHHSKGFSSSSLHKEQPRAVGVAASRG